MKKLKREKIKLPVGSGNIAGLFVLLALLIVSLVCLILYVPTIEKKAEVDDRDALYGTDVDDELVDNSKLTCDKKTNSDLIKKANKINVIYKFDQIQDDKPQIYRWCEDECYEETFYWNLDVFRIDFLNLPDNSTLIVTNNTNDDVIEIDSTKYEDNTYSFTTLEIGKSVKYKVEVKTQNEKCSGDTVRVFDFTLPAFNYNYYAAACQNNTSESCAMISYDALSEDVYTVYDFDESDYTDSKDDNTEDPVSSDKEKNKFEIKFTWYNVLIISLVVFILITIIMIIFISISLKRKKVQSEKI